MLTWSEDEIDLLTDFLFDSNLSNFDIARELSRPEAETAKMIRDLGLSWVRQKKKGRAVSRGQAALTTIMRKLLPGEEIVSEEPIGHRLRLDVYCPSYKLAAEYHGRQHFFYNAFFHGDKEGFRASQERDQRKEDLCKEMGIALVVFRYNDDLTEDTVYQRMLDAMRMTPYVKEEKPPTYAGDPYYEAMKEKQREYRKQQYQLKKARMR